MTRNDDRDLLTLQRRVDRYEKWISLLFLADLVVVFGVMAFGFLAMLAEGT